MQLYPSKSVSLITFKLVCNHHHQKHHQCFCTITTSISKTFHSKQKLCYLLNNNSSISFSPFWALIIANLLLGLELTNGPALGPNNHQSTSKFMTVSLGYLIFQFPYKSGIRQYCPFVTSLFHLALYFPDLSIL